MPRSTAVLETSASRELINIEADAAMPEANTSSNREDTVKDNTVYKEEAVSRELKSAPSYRVEVSLPDQKVRVYQGDSLIREMVASTGTTDKPTPEGSFKIQNRGEWFFSQKYQQGGQWWVSFQGWGIYLFHSVPMDAERHIIEEEADLLGKPASHGCVRLTVEDAQWFYRNIPEGTEVNIY